MCMLSSAACGARFTSSRCYRAAAKQGMLGRADFVERIVHLEPSGPFALS